LRLYADIRSEGEPLIVSVSGEAKREEGRGERGRSSGARVRLALREDWLVAEEALEEPETGVDVA
jgi:hypothetical protein